jgi:cytochrome c oxidase subunit 3
MAERAAAIAPFPDAARAREAGRFGMLVFLASEIMLFGGLFAGALAMRIEHAADYARASAELHLWLGGINTAVLLTSSLLVALVVAAVRAERSRLAAWFLAGAIVLGLAFLAIKGTEYGLEYKDGLVPGLDGGGLESPFQQLFMNLYFAATGLHAVHVTVGLALLAAMIWPFGAARRDPEALLIGNVALYWHLVDVVWLFLYPTLYLARG